MNAITRITARNVSADRLLRGLHEGMIDGAKRAMRRVDQGVTV